MKRFITGVCLLAFFVAFVCLRVCWLAGWLVRLVFCFFVWDVFKHRA